MATITATSMAGAAPKNSHPFTCMTCSIAFRSSELQRSHMRSDWHRYNLKRRVASLPPLSSEVFAEKVLSAQASSRAAADKASFEKHCQACNKTYFSENAFKNHLGSQRHRMMETVQGTPADDTSVSSIVTSVASLGVSETVAPENVDDPVVAAEFQDVISSMKDSHLEDSPVSRRPSRPHHSAELERRGSLLSGGAETPSQTGTVTSTAMPINRCLFCNFDSVNLDASLLHMGKTHGLFIPEQEYLDDLEGLITYLQAKITENMECICCHKLKNTMPAVQTHMRDKSHCRIAFDTDEEQLEIGQFYDFRSTYSDDDESEDESDNREDGGSKPRGGKLGAARRAQRAGLNDEDEEWEDEEDSDASEETSGSITPTKRNHRNLPQAFELDGELYLPSGRTAGHRSGARFYKQNLYGRSEEEREQRRMLTEGAHNAEDGAVNSETAVAQRKAYEANRSQLVSRANGGTGMRGVTEQAKRALLTQEKKERRSAEKAEQKRIWQMQRNRGKRGTGATGKRAIIFRDLMA